jgi:tRNA (cytidine/uridine-2'-O-)-methyltransferase
VNYEPYFHVVLYEPEIPQNTGNIGRTCVATAAKLWLVKPLGFSMEERMVRRAGLDYWPHLDWELTEDWDDVTSRLPARKPWFFSKKAERLYTDVTFEQGDVFVFGRETKGLPDSMLEANADRCLRLPIREQVRSLNLSNAVAVTLFEGLRQINKHN